MESFFYKNCHKPIQEPVAVIAEVSLHNLHATCSAVSSPSKTISAFVPQISLLLMNQQYW